MSNRVGFDLTRKRYGHQQKPAVIKRDDDKFIAGVMTDEQFDVMYDKIKAELGEKWMNTDSFPCRDKVRREAEHAERMAATCE